MAARIQKVGPGELSFGEVGSEIDIACQITSAELKPDVDQEDDQPVLCGDIVPGARTYTWTLNASLFQDWRAKGINAFSIENKGKQVPFTYEPDSDDGVMISGNVVIDPLSIGGDVESRATADWELSLVGDPEFAWADDDDDTGGDDGDGEV